MFNEASRDLTISLCVNRIDLDYTELCCLETFSYPLLILRILGDTTTDRMRLRFLRERGVLLTGHSGPSSVARGLFLGERLYI